MKGGSKKLVSKRQVVSNVGKSCRIGRRTWDQGIGLIVGRHGQKGGTILEEFCKVFPQVLFFLTVKDGEYLIEKERKG